MTDPLLSSVLRLRTKAKNIAHTHGRNPYRRRKRAIKLTQEERRTKQAVRDAKKLSLTTALTDARKAVMELAENLAKQFPSHNKDHYYRLIMQLPAKKSKRQISQWCAYLSIRLDTHNESLVAENGDDAQRARVTKDGLLQEISEEWAAMSPEAKRAVTAEKVQELEERRDNRLEAVHNSNVSACHDARVTLKNIQTELENLHKRTGTAVLMVATRGSIEVFGDPVVHYSDSRVQQFVESTVGATLEDIALRMEGYCVSGVQGVVGNHLERTLLLKGQLRNLILAKLCKSSFLRATRVVGVHADDITEDAAKRAKRGEIKRMNYTNFADAITAKVGIVAENWTSRFETPSGLSHLEVEIALRAWEAGTTRFRALTDEEWRAWLEARYHPQTAMSPSPEATPPTTDATSTPTASAHPSNSVPAENAQPAENTPTDENAPADTPRDPMPGEKRPPTDSEVHAPAAKHVCSGPMSVDFINSGTPAAGEAFSIPKSTRKKRSDAGVPRGPRKKPPNAAAENVPPSATMPATQPPKARARRGKKAATAQNVVAPAV
ncbi:hypothetical protein LXA43DRAFT_1060225 [Ganoderma leucocontextum]|nr:hypothetical protein LXA43DRAFT_1060225 [Ganoderma leucocontextum]